MYKDKVICMIITYNPELSVLRRNLESVLSQVDKLVVYDNASNNEKSIRHMCHEIGGDIIEFHNYTENMGVSIPLYDGVTHAKEHGFRYILTLDQDSIISEHSVDMLLSCMKSDMSIGIVGSNVNGRLSGGGKRTVITSGTLADVDKLILCGNYNKDLFIDLVDYDICFKMWRFGFKITVEPTAFLEHSFGDAQKHRFLGKSFYLLDYSPERLYYQTRNWGYMKLWYPEQKEELTAFKKRLNLKILKAVFFENNKWNKVCAYLKGLKDGIVSK